MFAKGTIVWAKIKGFPWWPAIIAKTIERKENNDVILPDAQVLVNFIGDNSHAQLGLDKVSEFNENFQLYSSNVKHRKLLDSIEIARKIANGESSYEHERDRIAENKKGKKKKRQFSEDDLSQEASDFENELLKKKPKLSIQQKYPSQNSSTTQTSLQMLLDSKKKILPLKNAIKTKDLISVSLESKGNEIIEQIAPLQIKKTKILQIMSDEKEELNSKGSPSYDQSDRETNFISDLEGLFKLCLEKILLFSKNNELQEPLRQEIASILTKSSRLFEELLSKPPSEDDTLLKETLSKDIGKYMGIILRLLEENNSFLKGLCFLEGSVKSLQNMIHKLKTRIYSKFFDFKTIIKGLEGNNGKILKRIDFEEEFEIPLSYQRERSSEDFNSPFEELSLSSQSLKDLDRSIIARIKKKPVLKKSSFLKKEENKGKLRKKVCLKMYQVLQTAYSLEKGLSHKVVLNLEEKIRTLYPEMGKEYKEESIKVMRLFKKRGVPGKEIEGLEGKEFDLIDLWKYA